MRTDFFKNALLLFTTACPIECDHCQYSCTKEISKEKWFTKEGLILVKNRLLELGAVSLRISGGEPLYDIEYFFQLLDLVKNDFPVIRVSSSGFWGRNEETARTIITRLRENNVSSLAISLDRFHLKRIPILAVENILKVGKEINFPVILRPLLDQESAFLVKEVNRIVKKYNPLIMICLMSPHGRAEKFKKELLGRHRFLDEALKVQTEESLLSQKEDQKKEKENGLDSPRKREGLKSERENEIKRGTAANLTVMPNGDSFSCCVAAKGNFMGNLVREPLEEIKKRAGFFLNKFLIENGSCSNFSALLPEGGRNQCRFCFDNPPKEDPLLEGGFFLGTQFIPINARDFSCEKLIPLYNGQNNLLVSLNFNKEEIGDFSLGEKILLNLEIAKSKNIPVSISKPIPPCFFKKRFLDFEDYRTFLKENNIPSSCKDCQELIGFKEEESILCSSKLKIKTSLREGEGFVKRDKAIGLVRDSREFKEPHSICTECLFRKEGICHCFFTQDQFKKDS